MSPSIPNAPLPSSCPTVTSNMLRPGNVSTTNKYSRRPFPRFILLRADTVFLSDKFEQAYPLRTIIRYFVSNAFNCRTTYFPPSIAILLRRSSSSYSSHVHQCGAIPACSHDLLKQRKTGQYNILQKYN